MQLYGFFNSSTSYRVRIALALKGLAYDYRAVDLRGGAQYQPEHRALSPIGGVPVLVTDDGLALTQSLAIIDYLDALHPQPRLLPQAPPERARALEIASLIACDIHPLNNLRVLRYLDGVLHADAQARKSWYAHWVAEGLGAVETLLERHRTGAYCLGDAATVADCCLVPQVANALRMGCDLSAMPQAMQVYRHCLEQPAFQAARPDRQPDYKAD